MSDSYLERPLAIQSAHPSDTWSLVRRLAVRNAWIALLGLAVVGCSHIPLSSADLARVRRPAFVSRIEAGAGPHSHVFEADSSYRRKLGEMSDEKADRILRRKLVRAMTRFEISDRLRADTLAFLPKRSPWTDSVAPTEVADAFEKYLVEEVPVHAPDYHLLEPLGADAVVEFVVEDYGMRSEDHHAGAYVRGHARMFLIRNGEEIWYQRFSEDGVDQGRPNLDPFRVAQKPELFRDEMAHLLDEAARGFVKELSPATEALGGARAQQRSKQRPKPPPPPKPGELPPPGPLD